jgi:hypothetical protein
VCVCISYVHDYTLLWDLIDAPTTSHHMLSVYAISFTKIDHDAPRNMIGVQYDTPRPWYVLILWSSDHVISHPSHLVIIVFHIHIIIPMQVSCQFIEPFAWNPPIYSHWFSPIIPSIIPSSFYTASLLWIWENIPCLIDPSPLKIRSNFHSKSSFEFNEVNWIQIHWTKYSFKIQILALEFKNILGLKS